MSIGQYGGGGNFSNTIHRKMSENTIIAKKGVERPPGVICWEYTILFIAMQKFAIFIFNLSVIDS